MIGGLSRRNKNEEKKKYSIIHWQTGIPTKSDLYLVTTTEGEVAFAGFLTDVASDVDKFKERVTAWCPLSDIGPYKGEN